MRSSSQTNKNFQMDLRRRLRLGEGRASSGLPCFCGAFSILATIGIVYELLKEVLLFFAAQKCPWSLLHGDSLAAQNPEIRIWPGPPP
jgi:hypothetical protein